MLNFPVRAEKSKTLSDSTRPKEEEGDTPRDIALTWTQKCKLKRERPTKTEFNGMIKQAEL